MSTIIAGHFDHVEQLQEAIKELSLHGFSPAEYAIYHLTPPGQDGLYFLGGDSGSDEGGRGAVMDAAAFGGHRAPAEALAGTGVGAYLGALSAAMNRMEAADANVAIIEAPADPPGGQMLAINVDRPGAEALAVTILGQTLARRVNRTSGQWAEGRWCDFDPRQPLLTLLKRDP
ncbi:hypothetical protein [Azoarcus sp. KH32C]|uniref:hypothetical protein n=1 Tax=Azoarcus sp. KH32C TaxID=748247 RepID=UPI0002386DBA|nr:hypothetical protein [Azoarcus sp. KH32C]BAL24942.1 hypothetical protein AZKH_2636 [Azoarcus sp. KH32C]